MYLNDLDANQNNSNVQLGLYPHDQQNVCSYIWSEFVKDDSQTSHSHLTFHIWEQYYRQLRYSYILLLLI